MQRVPGHSKVRCSAAILGGEACRVTQIAQRSLHNQALEDACFDQCRSQPHTLFLSLSDGQAVGGQLPAKMTDWGQSAYYLIDAATSHYKVVSDSEICCGAVHLELHEVDGSGNRLGMDGMLS